MRDQLIAIYIIPSITQILVPLALLAWQALGRNTSRAAWLMKTLAVTAYLCAIAIAGLWLLVPWHVSIGYLFILTALVLSQTRQARCTVLWPSEISQWIGTAIHAAVAMGSIGIMLYAATGRQSPNGNVAELVFPLHGGTYFVVGGGGNVLLNPHLQTLASERFRDYRGQSYGVDIVQLNAVGLRAGGIAPRDPREYVIFGASVHAPCTGTVLRAEDGFRDMPPLQPDREHLTGNYIFIDCRGTHILLAHLQQGTVRVRAGDTVTVGNVLARVGNSGQSSEPHLHIHAQRPSTTTAFLSGEPVPVRFSGRFLSRNDWVRQEVGLFAPPVGGLIALLSLFVLGLGYWFPILSWFRGWGASNDELRRVMAADGEIPNPQYRATLAVTIEAPAIAVWPWLVQMGYRRGGLYSYDWLDRLFGYLDRSSAQSVLPDFQELAVGDVIPIGGSPGFPVKAVESQRTLLLGGCANGMHWAWEFALVPADENNTRLISRNCVRVPHSLKSAILLLVIEPAAFLMTRKMLLGIKRRAERLSAAKTCLPGRAA